MKVLLIQPPIRDFYETDIRLQPLGLCMLKAIAREYLPDAEVVVLDFLQGHGKRTVPLPSELSYLRDYYAHHDLSPFRTFHPYYHFGADFQAIAREVEVQRPDLVGISSLFTPYHEEALTAARYIKGRLNVPILMGGSHESASPLGVLKSPHVDYIIRGEGERPFVKFLRAFEGAKGFADVPNLGFKHKSQVILNPLEKNFAFPELPPADFSDLPLTRYLLNKRPLCFIMSSRGCPHQCAFCSVHTTFAHGYQRRPAESVFREIESRYAQGYRVFDFEDDNLSFQRDEFERLLELLIRRFEPGEIQLVAMNGLSYLSLGLDTLRLMKNAGFDQLNVSLVSAAEETHRVLKRPHDLGRYVDAVHQASSLGFRIISYQILGLPSETLDSMIETMALMARLPVLIGASIFYLAPGCPLSRDFHAMTPAEMMRSHSTAMALETDHFCRDDLYTLFVTARILNFLKGIPLQTQRVGLQEALKRAQALKERGKIGAMLIQRIFDEKMLYASTRQGLKPLFHFQPNLFFRVLEELGFLQTLDGACVDC